MPPAPVAPGIAPDRLIDIEEIRRRFPGRSRGHIGVKTVWAWINRGARGPYGEQVRLRATPIGGRYVARESDLAEFVAALEVSCSRMRHLNYVD